jgi:hypothetical protein
MQIDLSAEKNLPDNRGSREEGRENRRENRREKANMWRVSAGPSRGDR